MILLCNVALFFVLFLPAAFITGIAGDFFVGPRPPPRLAYETLVFTLDVLPLLVPSLLMVPVLQFAYRRRMSALPRGRARALSAAVTPVALFIPHLAIYGDQFWSVPLVVLFAIPGALYGITLRR